MRDLSTKLYDIIDNDDGVQYEAKEILQQFADKIRRSPKEAVAIIDKVIESIDEYLIGNGVCPDCGERALIEDKASMTRVPYGSTTVELPGSGDIVCKECGWRKE